mmetsp:Transcript_48653/g.145331  ORF Transcript_48653/g.145331 Transcript_48653/m.145331 type:complete len:82 (+) Transcript_48653:195-440(+)
MRSPGFDSDGVTTFFVSVRAGVDAAVDTGLDVAELGFGALAGWARTPDPAPFLAPLPTGGAVDGGVLAAERGGLGGAGAAR